MERGNLISPERNPLIEHKQIGPLIVEARNIWDETGALFGSIKARQQLLVEKFFPRDFIYRHVIPAWDEQQVKQTLTEVCSKENIAVGVRTAYSKPKLGIAPWLMQTSYQNGSQFFSQATEEYQKWMQDRERPEAIIIMENPKYLGDPESARESFVLHLAVIPTESRCILEGRLGTDQIRSLEETNFNYRRHKNFNGHLNFKISPNNVVPLEFGWEKPFLMNSGIETRNCLQNIRQCLMSEVNLPNLLARLIALNTITSHETIQFQGRRSGSRSPYFDFFLGYGIRGAEEKSLVQQTIDNTRKKLLSWQKPNYE